MAGRYCDLCEGKVGEPADVFVRLTSAGVWPIPGASTTQAITLRTSACVTCHARVRELRRLRWITGAALASSFVLAFLLLGLGSTFTGATGRLFPLLALLISAIPGLIGGAVLVSRQRDVLGGFLHGPLFTRFEERAPEVSGLVRWKQLYVSDVAPPNGVLELDDVLGGRARDP